MIAAPDVMPFDLEMCVRLRCLVPVAYCYGFIKTVLFHFRLQVVCFFRGYFLTLSKKTYYLTSSTVYFFPPFF